MAMIDEEKIFQENKAKFFQDVAAGLTQKVSAQLSRKPLQNFRGEKFPWLEMMTEGDATAFHLAAKEGQAPMLQMLAEAGADINTVDSVGDSALHAAASKNQTSAIQVLCSLSVPINAQNNSGHTALYAATKQGHREAMALLLKNRAAVDLPNRFKVTPLAMAAKDNKPEVAAVLLAGGASLHAEDRTGITPIQHCIPGHTTILTQTFWFYAASAGDVEALRKLLGQQIGSVGKEDQGWKDLGRALFQPQGQDQFKLNAHKVLCNAKDGAGRTALSLATQAGKAAAVDYLLSQMSDPGISDELRETPLHHAARGGHVRIAAKLIDERAPLEALNQLGDHTPLCAPRTFATAHGHPRKKKESGPLIDGG